jgi:hypothetical protein
MREQDQRQIKRPQRQGPRELKELVASAGFVIGS